MQHSTSKLKSPEKPTGKAIPRTGSAAIKVAVSNGIHAKEQTRTPQFTTGESKFNVPEKALKKYGRSLTEYEHKEILHYKSVYFLGIHADKVVPCQKSGYDLEGTYRAVINDHIAYRYEIISLIGEGTYSQVFFAVDHKEKQRVAVKIVRNRNRYFEHSLREIEILNCLKRSYKNSSGSTDLLNHFIFRNHRVLIFKLLSTSLQQHLESSTDPLSMKQVVLWSYQILYTISQFHRKGVIHCDLKPDNLLFTNEELTTIRIIDFGAACSDQHILFKHIQHMFYRAPEVILGHPYGSPVDIWSFGCILLEMMLRRPVFPGENEHQQLLMIMEYRGYPPSGMLERSLRRKEFFDPYREVFLSEDSNGITRLSKTKTFPELIGLNCPALYSLVDACLEWDPFKRISALSALNHQFFRRSTYDSIQRNFNRRLTL